jgi:hypothetical protein
MANQMPVNKTDENVPTISNRSSTGVLFILELHGIYRSLKWQSHSLLLANFATMTFGIYAQQEGGSELLLTSLGAHISSDDAQRAEKNSARLLFLHCARQHLDK